MQVHESGAGHLGSFEMRQAGTVELRRQTLGQLARRQPSGLSVHEGRIRRPVAVVGTGRAF